MAKMTREKVHVFFSVKGIFDLSLAFLVVPVEVWLKVAYLPFQIKRVTLIYNTVSETGSASENKTFYLL